VEFGAATLVISQTTQTFLFFFLQSVLLQLTRFVVTSGWAPPNMFVHTIAVTSASPPYPPLDHGDPPLLGTSSRQN